MSHRPSHRRSPDRSYDRNHRRHNRSPSNETRDDREKHRSKTSPNNETRDDRDRHRSRRKRSHDRHDSPDRDKYRKRDHHSDKKAPVWGKAEDASPTKETKKEKEKPNFLTTGKLTEDTNTFRGVVIKYSEPPEARIPKRRWRLYPFKGEKALPVLYIHRQSGYLLGRDRKIADMPVDHPSCSKQHAALQYRLVPYKRDDGSSAQRIRPYVMDLDSANGTYLNGKRIDPRRYYELFEKDVLKFGYSSREYVMLHEHSKDSDEDDDMKDEDTVKEDDTKDEDTVKEEPVESEN